jgi:hypothetical protein
VSRKSKATVGGRHGVSTSALSGPSRREERLASAKALRQAEIAGRPFNSIIELCLIIVNMSDYRE